MKFHLIVRQLLIASVVAGAATGVRAGPFSAALEATRGGQVTTGTFHCQDNTYRFDLVENGQPLIVLYDGASGLTRLVAPAEKSYAEAGAGEPMSMLANPFSAYSHLSRTKTMRTEGTESIAGLPCRKRVVVSGEQVWVIGWVSDEFDVPLKVEIPIYGISVVLKNIKRGPQDAALFALPAGYTLKVEEPRPGAQPGWVGQVAAAPVVTLPFEKAVADGGIVRVRTQAGRWISIEGTNLRPDQGSFTVLPFKSGRSLGASEMGTTHLDPGDSGAMSVGVQPSKADELAVRVGSGPMKLKIGYIAPPPTAAAAATEPAAVEAAATTAASVNGPAAADMAARVEVSWQGPGNSDDFIAVARRDQAAGAAISRARVKEGNPVKLWAPSDPGDYEIRYVQGRGAKVLAQAPFTVNAVAAGVEAPGTANVAQRIEVKWQGPAADGDFISVALANQPPSAAAVRVPVKSGNPAKLWLPADPGQYEVRYVLARGTKLLAKAPLTTNPVTATIEPPASAKAGAEFEIRWQGPGYAEDFIAVGRNGQPANASLTTAKVRPGGTLKVRAPREPGTYEVRYVLGRGPRVLATAKITIESK